MSRKNNLEKRFSQIFFSLSHFSTWISVGLNADAAFCGVKNNHRNQRHFIEEAKWFGTYWSANWEFLFLLDRGEVGRCCKAERQLWDWLNSTQPQQSGVVGLNGGLAWIRAGVWNTSSICSPWVSCVGAGRVVLHGVTGKVIAHIS